MPDTITAAPPAIPIVLTGKDSAERMKEITDKLEQGIKDLFHSDRYKAYLAAMSKSHSYSSNNALLIAMQRADASLVTGFAKWRDSFKRTVKKGGKGIKIPGPTSYTIKQQVKCIDPTTKQVTTEEREITVQEFKPVTVFDVPQTEGRPLPGITVNVLTGSVEQYENFFTALEACFPCPYFL